MARWNRTSPHICTNAEHICPCSKCPVVCNCCKIKLKSSCVGPPSCNVLGILSFPIACNDGHIGEPWGHSCIPIKIEVSGNTTQRTRDSQDVQHYKILTIVTALGTENSRQATGFYVKPAKFAGMRTGVRGPTIMVTLV